MFHFRRVIAFLVSVLPWVLVIQSVGCSEAKKESPSIYDVSADSSTAAVKFSIGCPACLGTSGTETDDEAFHFTFQIWARDHSCGSEPLTGALLNGSPLEQHHWHLNGGSGQSSFIVTSPFGSHQVGIEHGTSCLFSDSPLVDQTPGQATGQLLRVKIVSVDSEPIDRDAGFFISFKQQPSPVLLRLVSLKEVADNPPHAVDFLEPPQHLRLLPVTFFSDPAPSPEVKSSIDPKTPHYSEEFRQKFRGENELTTYRFGHNSAGLTERPHRCHGIGCLLQAAFRSLSVPPFGPHRQQLMGISAVHKNISRAEEPEENEIIVEDEHGPSPLSYTPLLDDDSSSLDTDLTASSSTNPFVIALGIFTACLGCGCIFVVNHRSRCCLRRRAERRARREERRTERAYRRAAKSWALKNWWNRHVQRPYPSDYEEKRALILEQEGVLENAMQQEIQLLREDHEQQAMQEEIRQLRTAHDIVGQLVQAEEGRVQSDEATNRTRSSSGASGGPLSRTSSLPDYTSEPGSAGSLPPYEEYDENGLGTAADGFGVQYSPNVSEDEQADWTPDSSVIDVSPRPSFETLHTRYLRDDESEQQDLVRKR